MRRIRTEALSPRTFTPGFEVWPLRAESLGRPLDPYLVCDVFEMAVPYFPPHPHAGFAAVTYMLPSSAGGFINRDSLGDRSRIGPGDVHWTEAARGVIHEEVPEHPGTVARGLQLFVDLPAAEKLGAPAVYHCAEPGIPRQRFGDALGRVVAGAGLFEDVAVRPRSPCLLIDLEIPPRGMATLSAPASVNLFGLRLEGRLAQERQTEDDDRVVLVDIAEGEGVVVLEAGPAGARVVVMGGRPLRQPLAYGGPFIMSDMQQLTDAKRRFVHGEMGHLEPSFDQRL